MVLDLEQQVLLEPTRYGTAWAYLKFEHSKSMLTTLVPYQTATIGVLQHDQIQMYHTDALPLVSWLEQKCQWFGWPQMVYAIGHAETMVIQCQGLQMTAGTRSCHMPSKTLLNI